MAIPDQGEYSTSGETNPVGYGEAISVGVPFSNGNISRGIYVGGTGDIICKMAGDGANITHANVIAGMYYPIRCTEIVAGSTATQLVAWF